ncbi:MAG: LysM peptidoglycan-binding domain-containing protein [Geobacteraceae bacterium]|nr:LysM peptidoglycan-binding domain-containing protein [Geobacteraceae bacterium]
MKRIIFAVLLSLLPLALPLAADAQSDQPTIYVVKRGDTLWGLSNRFLKDPFYWPNLWARNQVITNPHLIFPGQRLRIYPDRIEIDDQRPQAMQTAQPEQTAEETTFTVSGAEGYILETDMEPSGTIIQTNHDRTIVGQDDVVYTDIGTSRGAKSGDTYSIFKKVKAVYHPVTYEFLGHKILSLGALKLTDMEDRSSRAMITRSYLEITSGSLLMPYRDKRREVALKAASRELHGLIIDTRMGNITTGESDVVYLDLGTAQGVEVGNMLYVVKDVKPDSRHVTRDVGTLPREVIGAVVVVETGEKTSTALVVKSADVIHVGDQVQLLKN